MSLGDVPEVTDGGNNRAVWIFPLDASAIPCFSYVTCLVQNFGMHWAAWGGCWDDASQVFLKAGFFVFLICVTRKIVGLVLTMSDFPSFLVP